MISEVTSDESVHVGFPRIGHPRRNVLTPSILGEIYDRGVVKVVSQRIFVDRPTIVLANNTLYKTMPESVGSCRKAVDGARIHCWVINSMVARCGGFQTKIVNEFRCHDVWQILVVCYMVELCYNDSLGLLKQDLVVCDSSGPLQRLSNEVMAT